MWAPQRWDPHVSHSKERCPVPHFWPSLVEIPFPSVSDSVSAASRIRQQRSRGGEGCWPEEHPGRRRERKTKRGSEDAVPERVDERQPGGCGHHRHPCRSLKVRRQHHRQARGRKPIASPFLSAPIFFLRLAIRCLCRFL